MSNQMDENSDAFKQQMRNALGTSSKSKSIKKTKSSFDLDLPSKKERKSGQLSCRCSRETEDTIAEIARKTGLAQSAIVNHLIEAALPSLKEKYLEVYE